MTLIFKNKRLVDAIKNGYLIMFEGVDGVGKTLYAQNVIKVNSKYTLVHENENVVYNHVYQNCYRRNTVFDRSAIGELIWPQIFNRHPQLTLATIKPFISKNVGDNYLIVLLHASTSLIMKRLKQRNEQNPPQYNINDVKQRYITLLQFHFNNKYIVINTN